VLKDTPPKDAHLEYSCIFSPDNLHGSGRVSYVSGS